MSAELTRALTELARSQHTTVNTVLQAAWAQLLMRLTGHSDVAFGTAVSGRPVDLAGAESIVGLMINTVPVRARIAATATVSDLLDQLQSGHNDTLEHEHLALNEIHRVTGHDRLFDTLLVYENYPIDTDALLGAHELAVTEISSREYNHYPLSMVVMPGHELRLRAEFDTDAFDTASISALIERFQQVLEIMTIDPGRRLSSIDLLDDDEHARLNQWTNRSVLTQLVPGLKSIPELFAAQVARAPEAGALTFKGRSMTYGELDEAANRLANLLVGNGAGRVNAWRYCFPGPPMPSWRFWRCSRQGRRTCRSTLRIPTRASRSCSRMPRRSLRLPPPSWRDGCTVPTCRSSASTTPPLPLSPPPRCRRRRPTTSRT